MYSKYNKNNYLIVSRGGLGDLVFLKVIVNCININYCNSFKYDIVTYDEYYNFCNKFFNESNIYSIPNRDFNLFWGYHTHQISNKINSNIIFFLSNCPEINNNVILNNFPNKFKIDNINLDYYKYDNSGNLFVDSRRRNIGIALTSTNRIKDMSSELSSAVIRILLDNNFVVYNFGPNDYFHDGDFINIFDIGDFYYMINIVSNLDLVITIDTSLMHMAAVNRIPFCAFFNITDPEKIIEYIKVSSWNNYEYYKVECFEQSFVLNKVISFLKNHEF